MRSVKTVPCRTQEWDFCYHRYSVTEKVKVRIVICGIVNIHIREVNCRINQAKTFISSFIMVCFQLCFKKCIQFNTAFTQGQNISDS